MMAPNWSNSRMRVVVLAMAVFFYSFPLADFQSLDNLGYEPRQYNEERSWKRFNEMPNYENEVYVEAFRQKPNPSYNRSPNENDYLNAYYDDETVSGGGDGAADDDDGKARVAKRAWKILFNDRSRSWGKREQQQGNWNNLRGLWGKRSPGTSSWGRLQGSWGK